MKKYIFSFICIITSILSFSQTLVRTSGISVQGIARDNSGVVQINQSISINAQLYYINSSNTEVNFITRTGNITTDGFGIFTYVIDINASEFAKIANYNAFLKVSSADIVFVKEKLKTVPYAIHAENGVPTGSIISYAGTTAPDGWLIADGSAIDMKYTALRTIFGSNLPDLRGVFLRGTGTQPLNDGRLVGPSLRQIQNDAVVNHVHAFSWSGSTNSTGDHTHDLAFDRWGGIHLSVGVTADAIEVSNGGTPNSDDSWLTNWFSTAGAHTHTYNVTGQSFDNTGGTETRPANYGINYIVKI